MRTSLHPNRPKESLDKVIIETYLSNNRCVELTKHPHFFPDMWLLVLVSRYQEFLAPILVVGGTIVSFNLTKSGSLSRAVLISHASIISNEDSSSFCISFKLSCLSFVEHYDAKCSIG